MKFRLCSVTGLSWLIICIEGQISPANDSVTFPHVAQIFHEFPHTWVRDFYLVNVYGKQSKASPAQQVRYVPCIYSVLDGVYMNMEEWTNQSWEIHAAKSHLHAPLPRVGALSYRSLRKVGVVKRGRSNYLSSKRVSPPNIAPRKRPSG